MFIVGTVIFAAYIYLTIWSIFYNSRKQQEENYPNLDGMGNKRNKNVFKRGNVPGRRPVRSRKKVL